MELKHEYRRVIDYDKELLIVPYGIETVCRAALIYRVVHF